MGVMSCGGPKVVQSKQEPQGQSPSPPYVSPKPANELPPTVSGGETAGPFLPPKIPPTVYAPFRQRINMPAPPLPEAKNTCFLPVEVRNYDGLDGCGLLLETDEGNLFSLANVPRGEVLEAGARIIIGFEYQKNAPANNCSNADAAIFVTCMRTLRISSGLPRPVVCEAYEVPSKWLYDLAIGYNATYITRFPWADERYVYLLETPYGQYLFDCRGYMICKPRKNCLGFIENYSEGVLIYEGS